MQLAARTDFRLEKIGGQPIWYVPADEDAEVALDIAWQKFTGGFEGAPVDLKLPRAALLHVPEAAMGVARFTFGQLCEQPLGGERLPAACA